eukprot:CAMPEP_0202884806 /NCGR_PEP_ID=MMETSP1391-20130828/41336_1 /ASSEMBLY_ACC=CAM_ASM_000867 /TAXON_ID=1034604 /ORGANISM="Chlamydomonas leiostraca, Strain SAG 11-49" /LENGTH=38 /DNA_ID= /DNA_START= /DNA_END= /DNA_ORIENTATION=
MAHWDEHRSVPAAAAPAPARSTCTLTLGSLVELCTPPR